MIAGWVEKGLAYGYAWLVRTEAESGLAWSDSDKNLIALYRGADDVYWNYVQVRIWKTKTP